MRAHVVCGWDAGGSLKAARSRYGLLGNVFAIQDEPQLGPLTSDDHRRAWWQVVEDQFGEGLQSEMTDGLHEQWRKARAEIFETASEIVIWSSDSAADQLHLRLAAAKLESFRGNICLVHLPTDEYGLAGVSRCRPETLAEFAQRATTISRYDLASLTRDFRERWENTDGVRLQTDQGLELRDYSIFDEPVLENCFAEFTKPAKVIAYTMSELDGRNWMSHIFLRWRLRLLVEAGLVEAIGTSWHLDGGDIHVRRREFD